MTHSPTLSCRRIADTHRRQVLRVDLQQSDVRARVGTDHTGGEFTFVGETDRDLVSAVQNVGIGQDVAVLAEDETGAERARRILALGRRRAPEIILQRMIVGHSRDTACGKRAGLRRADVDHGHALLFYKGGEVRQMQQARPRRDRGRRCVRRRRRGVALAGGEEKREGNEDPRATGRVWEQNLLRHGTWIQAGAARQRDANRASAPGRQGVTPSAIQIRASCAWSSIACIPLIPTLLSFS